MPSWESALGLTLGGCHLHANRLGTGVRKVAPASDPTLPAPTEAMRCAHAPRIRGSSARGGARSAGPNGLVSHTSMSRSGAGWQRRAHGEMSPRHGADDHDASRTSSTTAAASSPTAPACARTSASKHQRASAPTPPRPAGRDRRMLIGPQRDLGFPSMLRTRGRLTGTSRPPSITDPSSWPWRLAYRSDRDAL